MKSIQYSIVDVFAQRKYTGNQLAVFKDAGSLSDKEMQQMAKEINFSETTFITSASAKGEYDVRIFTPNEEVPFAGHPTLGAYARQASRVHDSCGRVARAGHRAQHDDVQRDRRAGSPQARDARA